ncbi:MAG: hypothetical protein ACLU9Q_08880 [Marvinbryantia sp.]|uniref:hypothetical protein n=1 Tax=Marvinbryantia sp. TaxID=2496532 RepID=UPI00399A9C85
MIWEIQDDLSENELLLKYDFADQKCIYWDFVLGSRYDLCAVFPWNGSETLQGLKKRGTRPILYHKKLRLHHRITKAAEASCYILFPAAIQDNMLTIGNQRSGNIVYVNRLHDQLDIMLMREKRKRRFFFFWKKYYAGEKQSLKINRNINALYYKLTGNSNLYMLGITGEAAYIYLREGEEITFFADRECTRKLEVNS